MPEIVNAPLSVSAARARFDFNDNVDAKSAAAMVAVRTKAKSLASVIVKGCPPGREQSLALTNLEEVVMWANKGIAVIPSSNGTVAPITEKVDPGDSD